MARRAKDPKTSKVSMDPTKNVELVQRISTVTEELEDILAISQGKTTHWEKIDIKDLIKSSKKGMGGNIHPFLFSVFRMLTLQGLIKGRMTFNAYTTGKGIGENIAIKNIGQLEKTLKSLGIGRAKVVKCSEDSVVIRVYNDITSMGIKNLKKPICYFEAGFLAGMLEKMLKFKVELEETKCRAMDHPYCQFELRRQKRDGDLQDSSSVLPADMYSEENIRLLTTLASHAITAIENALLFEKTKRQAVIDGLTQVYNHRYFQQTVRIEAKRADRHHTPLSLIMIDIDNFKKFNETCGHPKGDEVLKEIAAMLVHSVRSIDVVARYGGDEMAVILPQTDKEGAIVVANRIRKKTAELGEARGSKIKLSLSLGVATYSYDKKKHISSEGLISKADKALLTAKRRGRNKVEFLKA
ncbi:MAG: diguanylate cyclase [Candidatus Omnitrophota bacterium]